MSKSKVIVVTGGSRGIGKAIIEDILNRSNEEEEAKAIHVISVARSEEPLKQLQDKYGSSKFQYVVGDVSDPQTQLELLQLALSINNHIDSLVANAGVLDPVGPITQYKDESWKRHFDINFFSVVSMVSQFLPHMTNHNNGKDKTTQPGNIIMVSSGASVKSYQGWSCYCASKAALNSFAQSIAAEHDPSTIRSIAVAPGVVDTQMQVDIRDKLGPKGMPQEALKRFTDLFGNKQLLDPSVPGHVYAQLALEGVPSTLNGVYIRYNDDRLSQ